MGKTINQCSQPAPESSSTPWSLSPVPTVDTQALASPLSWSSLQLQLQAAPFCLCFTDTLFKFFNSANDSQRLAYYFKGGGRHRKVTKYTRSPCWNMMELGI